MIPITTPATSAKSARIQSIIDGARVREVCGQGAVHRVLPNGQHQAIVYGVVFSGATLDEAIAAARQGGSRQ